MEGNLKRRNGITQQGGTQLFTSFSAVIPLFFFMFRLLFIFMAVLVSFHCPLFIAVLLLFTFDFFSSSSHSFPLHDACTHKMHDVKTKQIKTSVASSFNMDYFNILAESKWTIVPWFREQCYIVSPSIFFTCVLRLMDVLYLKHGHFLPAVANTYTAAQSQPLQFYYIFVANSLWSTTKWACKQIYFPTTRVTQAHNNRHKHAVTGRRVLRL